MSLLDFEFISVIGKGAFSRVEKVKRKEDAKIYALKKVAFAKLTEKEKANALNEVRLIASLSSDYIISFKQSFFSSNTLCIVMEYAPRGDLLSFIEKQKKEKIKINEQTIWHYTLCIAKGLKILHDLNILHRDVKSANVFIIDD